MTIRVRCQTNPSKQTTLLDGIDVGPPKQHMCWRGFNRSVHEAMNNISNVKLYLKTRRGNVNDRIIDFVVLKVQCHVDLTRYMHIDRHNISGQRATM